MENFGAVGKKGTAAHVAGKFWCRRKKTAEHVNGKFWCGRKKGTAAHVAGKFVPSEKENCRTRGLENLVAEKSMCSSRQPRKFLHVCKLEKKLLQLHVFTNRLCKQAY